MLIHLKDNFCLVLVAFAFFQLLIIFKSETQQAFISQIVWFIAFCIEEK